MLVCCCFYLKISNFLSPGCRIITWISWNHHILLLFEKMKEKVIRNYLSYKLVLLYVKGTHVCYPVFAFTFLTNSKRKNEFLHILVVLASQCLF